MAAAVVVLALGIGGSGRATPTRLALLDATGVTGHTLSSGSLDVVLRTEADRLDGVVAGKVGSTRLLLLLAAPFLGLALVLLFPAFRPRRAAASPFPVARLRRSVGLRAPPSSLLVALIP